MTTGTTVERWGTFELTLGGPADGNPYRDVEFGAEFRHGHRVVPVDGFYDGDGVYRVRFMPDREGAWTYTTRSRAPALDGTAGGFTCTPAGPGNHGPVRVAGPRTFRYADGTRYLPFGTTCYHWTHDEDLKAEEETLRTLAASPFNKVRMCLLPTLDMAPPRLVFPGLGPGRPRPGELDRSRFDPAFFAHFEARVRDLLELGVEADVIILHPYDKGHWGVDDMSSEEDLFLVRYVVARLAAYRNVWWSVANEYDFNKAKTVEDWTRIGQYVQRRDPYQHLRSIHNGTRMYEYERIYDFRHAWTTHQSIQHWDARMTPEWLDRVRKPVVIDEIGYEGVLGRRWGNLSGRVLLRQFWHGMAAGAYVGHGECFPEQDPDDWAWISRGGRLHGEIPARIAFQRRLWEESPDARFWYFGDRLHRHYDVELPDDGVPRVLDLIDTWNMTVSPLPGGPHHGTVRVPMDHRPDLALRIRKVT
ncbi:DUF5060 domain-containing protein [Streptomyces sp. NBC_01320]|uniref:DUF5060 domain-containing protein n=1 Tax=Streptomyces sp. NBC_01320 TaxID=2903824 RepID=UPI002E132347|nr:DUF5060 domain-containing protein [Streptomyces sp. NBC_01320]